MANINEILARAAALRDETALNSISPERAGGIMYDTLLALNELWLQQGSALVISKIYASVAAMEADTAPVSDLTGKPLRPGQIVVIASSDSDNGSVYRYNGTESPSWSLVGSIGNLDPVDSLDSDSTTLPLAAHQGKVLDGKISQLGQEVSELLLNESIGVRFFLNGNGIIVVNNTGNLGKLKNLNKDHAYRVYILNPDVDMTGTGGSESSRFALWTGTNTLLLNIKVGTSLEDYYDIPAGSLSNDNNLWISCRCAIGAILRCYIVDMTVLLSKEYTDSLFSSLITNVNKPIEGWKEGYYVNTQGDTLDIATKEVASSGWEYIVLDCIPGDKFIVNNKNSGGSARAYCFYDSNNNLLERCPTTGEIVNLQITAPTNAAKVLFNNFQFGTGSWAIYYKIYNNQINPNCILVYDFASKSYVNQQIEEAINNDEKIVDLLLFAGQSNMAGRGATNSTHPEGFPTLENGAGWEYRAISDPSKLYPIAEPFGVNENKSGGISESNKTGSMVTAFANAYYREARVPIVGVSASKGGTTINQWQTDGTLLPDALQRFSDAITFLTNNGYTIRHKYVVWLQGESDGDSGTTGADYKTLLQSMFSAFQNIGAEKLLLIRIGKRSYDEAYSTIIQAQTELCQSSDDIIMISTALSDFRRRGYMKDSYHYYQDGYNLIGQYAGHNAAVYAQFRVERIQYDSENSVDYMYNSYKCD